MKKTALYPWVFFIGALLTLVTLLIHGSLSSIYSDSSKSPVSSQSRNGLSFVEPPDAAELADARYSIGDLLHIKASVSRELQELEHKRRKLLDEIVNLNRKTDEVRNDIVKVQSELDKTHKSMEQAKLMRLEAMEKNTPEMAPPLQLIPQYDLISKNVSAYSAQTCTFETCFEYSQCPLSADFKVFAYQRDIISDLLDIDTITQDPTVACLYIFSGDAAEVSKLAHWRGEGRNHIVVDSKSRRTDIMNRAIYASMDSPLRSGFDIVLPYTEQFYDILSLPTISPARRKYLLSFQGKLAEPTVKELTVIAILKKLQMTMTDDKFLVHFDCLGDLQPGEDDEYALCGSSNSREEILKESTFTLILAPQNQDWRTTKLLQRRIYESLKYGSIPIVMGLVDLPFSEVIDWRKCALFLAKARARELHFFLRTVADVDILNLRRSGRLVWETYLATEEKVMRTIISLLKDKIGLPPQMIKDAASPAAFNSTFVPLRVDPSPPEEEVDEYLGPMEPPSPSPKFLRNYTFTSVNAYERWNSWYEPFSLFPYTPFDPVVPSEARFIGSTTGFRPVNSGAGGAGKEFSEVIGGNRPREQFTVVMLAYERDQVMMSSIARLAGVPYLNKVIVVWNSPKPPSEDLRWPEIGVPVVVIQAEKNSLNNRFLPFDEIETESILSVDDDVRLGHDEIIFGFRVWREQRDRIVGFPGRFHAWDPLYGGWHYNSNYSCELSMVLTGAAFFHKYYSYLYTSSMPQAIRDKVDEYMNCEDLAMNFLVSHRTRQPPVKVTNRWTFRCPGCPQTLSEDETHFEERHKCMNFFTQVYGYMPLLITQYRVDSVLSKTRIPHDKQKCFKYV